EQQLWLHLRCDQLQALRFRRQHRIGPYIADFCCPRARVVVELDGDSHGGRSEYDARRDAYLQSRYYRVLRFTNQELARSPEAVVKEILRQCELQWARPSPQPSPRDGERE